MQPLGCWSIFSPSIPGRLRCSFLRDRAFKLLAESGVSPEVALLELYASGELGEIGRATASPGMWNQLKLHSHTSQDGQLTHGTQFSEPMRRR